MVAKYFITEESTIEWMRPYWLGSSLCLVLCAFWILDSIKDPLFARLVDGKLEQHQPTAKLFSVLCTLVLVCGMEYVANRRLRQASSLDGGEHEGEETAEATMGTTTAARNDQVLDAGGVWTRSILHSHEFSRRPRRRTVDDTISISIFYQVGFPYVVAFTVIAGVVLQFQVAEEDGILEGFDVWYVLAYLLHATIESFGSIAVATFWSYTNSTLCLEDAERHYGPIIALAQLGAIAGSTVVASGRWEEPELLYVVSLIIILQMLTMRGYDRTFQPTSQLASTTKMDDDEKSILTWQDHDATLTKPFWSGIYLIFNHYYVILILGVSCLYEVALTCLDYQMKLLGYAKFAAKQDDPMELLGQTPQIIMETASSVTGDNSIPTMSFTEFMGYYGQVVNVTSFLLSSMIFPVLINRMGLKVTLRIFPTFLLIITIIAYGAMPGNLTVLFVSLSLLKAMTYSLHDPAKELLYIPTSNAVKFRAKFWIDVVGERISKAVGGLFNTFSGSVEKSIRVGSLPSILSGAGLWLACFYVGIEFDRLLRTGTVVGLENSIDPTTYKKLPRREEETEDDDDDRRDSPFTNDGELPEVELGDDGSLSTLGLDTIDGDDNRDHQDSSRLLRAMPTIVRI